MRPLVLGVDVVLAACSAQTTGQARTMAPPGFPGDHSRLTPGAPGQALRPGPQTLRLHAALTEATPSSSGVWGHPGMRLEVRIRARQPLS